MVARIRSALLFWLACFELLAIWRRWRGLRWSGPLLSRLLPLVLLRTWRSALHPVAGLLVLPAVALQGVLGSLRNWQFKPEHRLRPGRYPDRTISRLDIPTLSGPVPALHVVPAGGGSAAVCYAHGSGSDKDFYTWNMADALVARGLAVLIIDLDGHGESPRPQAFPAILENVNGAVHWLRAHYSKVGVIGTSMGGCIAARAVAEGAAVDALVIQGSPVYLRLTHAQVWLEALQLLQPAVFDQLREGSPYHHIRAWLDTPRIRARIGTRDLIAALDLIGSLRCIGQQPQPPTPLLLVYAANDTIVPRIQAEQVRLAVSGYAAFHLLPRASHLSLTIDPRLHNLVSTWLAAQLVS